tara:strand:- start:586 stop:999 length:414 start_codon:yes stop_codon:yes gene_type:complete
LEYRYFGNRTNYLYSRKIKMSLDIIIDEAIERLKEEKYKLRTFQVELLLKIDSEYGVEETLQDIRSIGGVTVVTALDSLFRKDSGSYLSHIKIKFHPQEDSTTAKKFVKDHLLPIIRSTEIPGTTVVRVVASVQQIA